MSKVSQAVDTAEGFFSGFNLNSLLTKAIVALVAGAALAGFVAWGIHEHRGEIRDADKAGYDRAKAEDAKALADSEAKAQSGLALGWKLADKDTAALAGSSQAINDALKEADNANAKSPGSTDCGADLSTPGSLFRRGKRNH